MERSGRDGSSAGNDDRALTIRTVYGFGTEHKLGMVAGADRFQNFDSPSACRAANATSDFTWAEGTGST